MKRFRLHIFLFFISLFIPMTILIYRTYISLEQEETAALRFFAETIFNEMEEELSSLIVREELRSVDEYNLPNRYGNTEASQIKDKNNDERIEAPYILGYLQNNPDGTYQSPFRLNKGINENVSQAELDQVNTIFNEKKTHAPEVFKLKSSVVTELSEEMKQAAPAASSKEAESFAGKYLDIARSKKQKTYLGKSETRVEEISRDQAINISQAQDILPEAEKDNNPALGFESKASPVPAMKQTDNLLSDEDFSQKNERLLNDLKLEVEIDPLQSVFIDDEKIFIFRRIVLNNSIFRQGFILNTHAFFAYLSNRFFINQPISDYTQLTISAHDTKRNVLNFDSGSSVKKTKFEMKRSFPRPFSFMTMSLKSDKIPASTGRKTIHMMSLAILLISFAGFFTMYKSIKTMISLSERRSDFVSSVTHELKTPLTNIRMYIEMLEYGIAQSKERKEDYFRILNSESGRLSRLINNVLEFSKLEKKTESF